MSLSDRSQRRNTRQNLPASSAETHSDPVLVEQTRGGSREAYGLLVVRYSRSVRALCLARLGVGRLGLLRDGCGDADDVVQETFLRAYQGLARLEDPERFGAYVHRIAQNICIDCLRRGRKPAMSLDEVELEPPKEPGKLTDVREERLSRLRKFVGRLPEALREAVLLFYFEALSHAEIAARLGVTEAAVNQRLHRARLSLKQAFGQEEAL